MIDNKNNQNSTAKSYLVNVGGKTEVWDEATYTELKDALYSKYPDANMFELDNMTDFSAVDDEMQYVVNIGDRTETWDAATMKELGSALKEKYPNATVQSLKYKDYWYDKALADEESLKTMQGDLEALNKELGGKQRWSPEYSAIEAQINDKRGQMAQTKSSYDSNPRVVEANERHEAEQAADLEEYNKNYLPNLRNTFIKWAKDDVDLREVAKEDRIFNMDPLTGEPQFASLKDIKSIKKGDGLVARHTMEQYMSAFAFLNKAERIRNEHSSFGEGMKNTAMNWMEAWGSQSDIKTYQEIYGILKRLEYKFGKLDELSEEDLKANLTKSEQALILAFFEYTSAQAEIQDDASWIYEAGGIAADAIPFVLEFIATGGLASAAGKVATKGLSKAMTSWIKGATKGTFRRAARKVVAKGVRGTVRGLTQAAVITPLRPTAYTNVMKSMTQIDKDGKLKDSGSDIAIAIADEYIETLSELSGGAITSVLGGVGKGAARKFLSKGMYDTFATWGKKLSNLSGVKLAKRAQFHGLPVEVAEEYFGNALREMYDAKALDKMHEGDNFWSMLVGFLPMTVITGGLGMGQYVNAKNKVNKGAARLGDILAKEGYKDDQIEAVVALAQELSPYSLSEKLDPILTSMTKSGASKESRDAVIKYAMDVVRYKTLEGTVNEPESTKRQEKLDELTGKFGTFYQTKNEGTKWQEENVTTAKLNNGSLAFLTSGKNEAGEFDAIDINTGNKIRITESYIASVKDKNGNDVVLMSTRPLNTYLTELVMAERQKTIADYEAAYNNGQEMTVADLSYLNEQEQKAKENLLNTGIASRENSFTGESLNLSSDELLTLSEQDEFTEEESNAIRELAIAKRTNEGLIDKLKQPIISSIDSRNSIASNASNNETLTVGTHNGKTVYVKGGVQTSNGKIVKPDNAKGYPVEIVDAATGEMSVVDSKELTNVGNVNTSTWNSSYEAGMMKAFEQKIEELRNATSPNEILAEVYELVGKKVYLNINDNITLVEVDQILPSMEVLIKGKKGDLGGKSVLAVGIDEFYNMIYRDANGNHVLPNEEQESEVADYRGETVSILINGVPTSVEVMSQDNSSDSIVYEYTDENGNTKRGRSTISEFSNAIEQANKYVPEQTSVQEETPVAETQEQPIEETVSEEVVVEEPAEAPIENAPLDPESINWDELFEQDKEAYFIEMQNQFGEEAVDILNEEIDAAQSELDALAKAKTKSQNDRIKNRNKKKALQSRIDALNEMVAKLTTPPESQLITEPTQEAPVKTVALSASVNNEDRLEIPKKPVIKRPRTIKGMSALDPMTSTELAARELGLKNGGIKLTKESFLHHTGYGTSEANALKGLFLSKDKGGKTVEEAGERLMEIDREYDLGLFDQNDPNAGINAILEALSENRTMGELRSYIARQRQAEAQREADAIYAYEMEQYEKILDDALRDDVFAEELKAGKAYTEDEYNELMTILAEEINDYDTGNHGEIDILYETEDIGDLPAAEGEAYGGIERSNQVLQETQSVQTSGERDSQRRGVNQNIVGEDASSPVHNEESSDNERGSSEEEFVSSLDEDMPDFTQESERVPVAPNPVADPVAEAKNREERLLSLIERKGVSDALKRDSAFNAGKEVADFFATYDEYEAYEAEATDFGEYNEEFERGVKASFANREQSTQYHIGEASTQNDVISEELGELVAEWIRQGGNFVVVDKAQMEQELSNDSSAKTLETPDGVVYGFVKDGVVYLNPSLINPNTAIHEYTHLWDNALMQLNPELWAKGKALMKQTPIWDEVLNDPNYADIKDNENLVASEVHSRLVGERGAERLNQLEQQAREEGITKSAKKLSILGRLREWLNEATKWLKSAFAQWNNSEIESIELSDFLDMPLSDLANFTQFTIGNNAQTDALNSKQTKEPGGMLTDEQLGINQIQFSISKNNRATIETWLNKRPDLKQNEKDAFMLYIDNREPVQQLAMARWFSKGAIRLPEDLTAIDNAFKFARKMNVDPMKYDTPAAVNKDYVDRFGEEKKEDSNRELLSPDDARFEGVLTNKVDYGNGIVVYDVQNDIEHGQRAVRDLMNDHLGEEFNCWCLLYADSKGNPTKGSEEMWWHYNKTQKKVAFKDRKICAFCASTGRSSEWWDLHDQSHGKSIPVEAEVEGDKLGRRSICEFDGKKIRPVKKAPMYRGNKKSGLYEEWANSDPNSITLRTTRKGGKDDGVRETWDGKGNLLSVGRFKKGKHAGDFVEYASNGQVTHKVSFDQNGNVHGDYVTYSPKGQLLESRHYNHGTLDGESVTYNEKGQLLHSATYDNGFRTGYEVEYNKRGKLLSKLYHNTYKEGTKTITVTHEGGPEGKITIYTKRSTNYGPADERFRLTEDKGSWFQKPFTEVSVKRNGVEITYYRNGVTHYKDSEIEVTKQSNGISVFSIKDNNKSYFFNNKGKLTSYEGNQDKQTLAEHQEEAAKIWEKVTNVKQNGKSMADEMVSDMMASIDKPVPDMSNNDTDGIFFRSSDSPITPEMDAEYLAAVERGDMETAQRMVLEAAKLAMPNTKVVDENGYPKVVYHGTGGNFYTFRDTSDSNELGAGYYFSDSYDMAKRYSEDATLSDNEAKIDSLADDLYYEIDPEDELTGEESRKAYERAREMARKQLFANSHVKSVFLNLENPRILSKNSPDYDTAVQGGYNIYNEGLFAKRFNDGVIDETFTERHETLQGNQYVAYQPSQIKSADPVTYDDNGNVIPLSERFNHEKKDIRFRKGENNTKFVEQFEFKQNNEKQQLEYSDEFRRLQEESTRMSGQLVSEKDGVQQAAIRGLVGGIGRTLQRELDRATSGRGNKLRTVVNDSKGTSFDIIENVDGRLFHDIFEIVRTYLPNGELVDLHDNYDDAICYITSDGLAGFAVDKDGNLISVYSLYGKSKKGFLGAIKDLITEAGATHLDGYNSEKQPLAEIYSKVFGWKVASMMDYNMEYDHDNIAENHGMPQVAFMVNTEAEIETKHFDKDQYDEAVAYQLEQVETSQRIDAQNAAVDFTTGETRQGIIERAVNKEAAKLGVTVTYKTRSEMPKGHENDKGYYNTKTGEIVICTENNSSIADAIQTILHEAVAHKGLRQLMGDRFNEFINRVYNSLDAETKAKVDSLAENHYNGDKMVAMEEYMASLAEKENFAETSVWEKIKSIFESIINSILGRNDIQIGDKELRYILRASYNNMVNPNTMNTIEGWAKDTNMRNELGINEATPEIMSRTGIDPNAVSAETAKQVYDRAVSEGWNEFQRQFQDAYQPVRIAIEAIQQETGNIPIEDYENYLLIQNQTSSRSRVEIDNFQRKYYEPIVEQVNKIIDKLLESRGLKNNKKNRAEIYAEVRQYMIAKHGLERNEYYQGHKTRPLNKEEREHARKNIEQDYADELARIASTSTYTGSERKAQEELAKQKFEEQLEGISSMVTFDVRDYSGLTSLFGLDPSEFEEAEMQAKEVVDKFERELGRVDDKTSGKIVKLSAEIEALWKKINAATDKTLRHSYESGMISRQQYDDIRSMFDFYIPLRGFDETTAEDVYSYARFEGNRFNAAVQKAEGRTSVADDPIATIMNMAESEIAQGNKNRAKQALYNYLLNRAQGKEKQNSLMQVEDVWYVITKDENGNDVYSIASPNHEAGETWEEFENRMSTLEAEEKAVKSKKGQVDVGMRFQKKRNQNAHYIYLKINGVDKAIYINGDPKAADAVNGTYQQKRQLGEEKFRQINRLVSSTFTNYSLEFTARNFFRDMFYSHINMGIKEKDPAYRKTFRKNWRNNNMVTMLKMLKAYRAGEYDNKSLNASEASFVEFMENGGQTGYTLINSVESHKKDLEKSLERIRKGSRNGGLKNSTVFKYTLGAIELLNEASELVTRFAAFKTSRDMGRSVVESINDAKEITVNFNTKGAQDGTGWMGAIARYFGWSKYFFNASVQGVQNLKAMADANKLKFCGVVGGMMGLGFLMPVLTSAIASMFGGDDDEYWNIPEYDRQNNLCICIGNGNYIKIPLPIGFREIYAMGDMTAALAFDKRFHRDIWSVGMDYANKIASLTLPINPLEGRANGLSFWNTFLSTALPSSFQFAIQNATNTDWKGAPLQKEYTWNKDDPQWMKAFENAPDWMVGLSKWCNENINLDGDYRGLVDWSPEKLDNTLSNLFGGVYTLIKKTGNSISAAWNEEERNLSNIPLAGVVFGTGIESDGRFVTDAYFDMKDYYDSNVNRIKRVANNFGLSLEDIFVKQKGAHHPKVQEIYGNKNFEWMKEWYLGHEGNRKGSSKAEKLGLNQLKQDIKDLQKSIAEREERGMSTEKKQEKLIEKQKMFDEYYRDFTYRLLEMD